MEELTADGRRKHFDVLSTSRLKPNPDRFGQATVQEGNPIGGRRVLGSCVSTKIGPSQAPPYGRLSAVAASHPLRPANTAPVVVTYSSTRRSRKDTPVIQSIS